MNAGRPRSWTRDVSSACVALSLTALVTSRATNAQAPATSAASVDLASVENGGRVEWVTEENRGDGSAANVIARTTHYGWLGAWAFPQDLVFSFFSRQSALVAGVEVNPASGANQATAKEVEIWTSVQSPTEGFARVAAATLENKNALQALTFPPVEAKFVKLRILSSYAPDQRAVLSRVRILEGQRDGYTSILVRNPALGALVRGVLPAPPADAPVKLPAPGVAPTCAAPVPPANSRFLQSKVVLLVEGSQGTQRAYVNDPYDLKEKNLSEPAVGGVTLRLISPDVLAPAILISEPLVDTVVLGQICTIGERMSKAFKQALMAWVAAGHKLLIQDSDSCAQSPDYSFLPYPFKTVNPGSNGARGLAGILEDSTLVSSNKRDPSFINMPLWKEGPNDLGDTNVVVESDARWCGVMWSKNKLQKSGFGLAYLPLRARSDHLRRLRLRSGRHGAIPQAGRAGAEAAVRSRLPRLLQSPRRVRDRDGQPAEVAVDGAFVDLHVPALDSRQLRLLGPRDARGPCHACGPHRHGEAFRHPG